jgi:hypothetical protein
VCFCVAIAGQYKQGISGKAVSERFIRMRREDCWDLSTNTDPVGNGGTPAKGTPRKRNTPAKNGGKKNGNGVTGEENGDEDDESDFGTTPSKKKGVLNKTKGGRVAKANGGAKSKAKSFDEDDDEVCHRPLYGPSNMQILTSGIGDWHPQDGGIRDL